MTWVGWLVEVEPGARFAAAGSALGSVAAVPLLSAAVVAALLELLLQPRGPRTRQVARPAKLIARVRRGAERMLLLRLLVIVVLAPGVQVGWRLM